MPANGTEAATLSQIKEYVEYTQTQLEGYVDDAIASQPPSTDVDIDQVYPVGSIYMSMSATSPSSLFGGTWERIQGRFLMASNSSYDAGDTGGSNDAIVVTHSHSASAENNGSHSHTISGGAHSHTGDVLSGGSSHTHAINYSWNAGNASTGSDWRIVIQDKNNGAGSPGTQTDASRGIGNSGSHTHTLSVDQSYSHSHSMTSSGSHGHNVNVFNAGSSGTNKNMPSFIAVNVWQRTA